MAKRKKQNKKIDTSSPRSSSTIGGSLSAELGKLEFSALAPGPVQTIEEEAPESHMVSGNQEVFTSWRTNISKKGRGGKTVTLIHHILNIEFYRKELGRALGTGAKIEDGVLVLQGDQRSAVEAFIVGPKKHGA